MDESSWIHIGGEVRTAYNDTTAQYRC